MPNVTKDDLVNDLLTLLLEKNPHGQMAIHKANCKMIVNKLMGEIVNSLGKGHRVVIQELGSFSPVFKAARKVRNIHEDKEIQVPEKYSVRFKPSKNVKELLTRNLL